MLKAKHLINWLITTILLQTLSLFCNKLKNWETWFLPSIGSYTTRIVRLYAVWCWKVENCRCLEPLQLNFPPSIDCFDLSLKRWKITCCPEFSELQRGPTGTGFESDYYGKGAPKVVLRSTAAYVYNYSENFINV